MLVDSASRSAEVSAERPAKELVRRGAIVVRPLRASDRDELVRGFEHLSPESRHRRFLAFVRHLDAAQLAALLRVDGHDHVALVAVNVDDAGVERRGVGVARSIRDHDDREVAEFAIVIADEWQGRGIGRLLAVQLSAAAFREGIRRWKATMLTDNQAIRRLLASCTDPMSLQAQGCGVVEGIYRLRPPAE